MSQAIPSPDPTGPVVLLRDVRLSYGSHVVLDDIGFSVRRGETMCVLGGSGVGKSTILKLILHLEEPDSGHVEVLGHNIETAGRSEIFEARQRMGMVFQGSALFDSLPIFGLAGFHPVEPFHQTPRQQRKEGSHDFCVKALLRSLFLSGSARNRVGRFGVVHVFSTEKSSQHRREVLSQAASV